MGRRETASISISVFSMAVNDGLLAFSFWLPPRRSRAKLAEAVSSRFSADCRGAEQTGLSRDLSIGWRRLQEQTGPNLWQVIGRTVPPFLILADRGRGHVNIAA